MENKQREDFIQAVVVFLTQFPEDRIMILIEGDTGLKTMGTTPGYVWQFGILKSALLALEERYKRAINLEVSAAEEKKISDEIDLEVKSASGKAN